MKKILTIVLILALIAAIPPVRAKVGTAAIPLLEKLGPVGAGLLKPARNMGAKSGAAAIARLMANERQEGREPPTPRQFEQWVVRRSGDPELVTDPWGGKYWLTVERNVYTVGSSGADGRRGTSDDILRVVN